MDVKTRYCILRVVVGWFTRTTNREGGGTHVIYLSEAHRAELGADLEAAAGDLPQLVNSHSFGDLDQRDAVLGLKVKHRLGSVCGQLSILQCNILPI